MRHATYGKTNDLKVYRSLTCEWLKIRSDNMIKWNPGFDASVSFGIARIMLSTEWPQIYPWKNERSGDPRVPLKEYLSLNPILLFQSQILSHVEF